ncbi:TetR/AcrR family transcriptional regulator [Paenibacillus sp. CFBP 13594]|nr:TetR/AcrR family transcriptional regulator [Paenibacillus sp. CFBP 13594]
MIDKKVDLRVTRTHKLLTMALLDLLCEKGQLFSNITINEICDKAMVHRTTFYKHFKDKFALLSSTLTCRPSGLFTHECRRSITAAFTKRI